MSLDPISITPPTEGTTDWDDPLNAILVSIAGSLNSIVTAVNAITPGTGWTPVLAIASDGERRVLKVTDWTGGTGTKPTINQYVGSSGFVSTAAAAVDVRGATGATGSTGSAGPNNLYVSATAPASPVANQTVWIDIS